ncbi:hypothetical protein KORDIASMS9_04076 [Kordia sp. SMS9]|uniref:hypothetical protein n=1 Tax=Kordia sp. SMS9 TaxID=2282170 RepID=UPI000E0CE31D|nr:hypothetical protein [Kordia sp. SMS9]AXG71818.1 hypothetical protein KORDIASMS9_04076 [Kordia sp. SMS9]
MSGFLALANSIMRNNKRKRINKMERVERYIGTKSSSAEYKEASDYMLHKIKKEVQEQQQKSRRNTILIFVVSGVILLALLYYFLFLYKIPVESTGIFTFD